MDKLRLTNVDTGDVLEEWESAEFSSDYLTPCDSFRFEAGSDDAPLVVAKRFHVDAHVRVSIVFEGGGKPLDLLDGYVDSTEVDVARSGGGGRRCVIEGRDFLSDVVDSNVDPRLKLPANPTLEQIIDTVLKGEPFKLDYDPADENVIANITVNQRMKKPKRKAPTRPSRRSKKTKAREGYRPRDGESAYAYLARMCSLFGYNLSASFAKGKRVVILGGPDYDQPSQCTLRLLDGPAGAANNVLYASTRLDLTNVPREVIVKGGAFGIGESIKNLSVYRRKLTTRPRQVYVSDARAKDKETSERIARATMGKLTRTFAKYRAKVQGFKDPETHNVYLVNTMADVIDENSGAKGPMWIESSTFRQSRRAGTTADLVLIPRNTYVLDYLPEETVGEDGDDLRLKEQMTGVPVEEASLLYNGVDLLKEKKPKKR